MNQVLTIVGASVRAAAFSAVRAGYCVHAADLFADADLRCISKAAPIARYPADLSTVVEGPQSGAWMYTGALENYPSLVDTLARKRQLWGNPAAVLRRVRNPTRLAAVLDRAGLRRPQLELDAATVPRDGRWLYKPRHSAGGAQISFWDHAAPPVDRSTRGYFQQFVEGLDCSAVYVAAGGRALLLGVSRQLVGQSWAGAGGFRYCGSIGPIQLPDAVTSDFARLGDVLAHEFKLVGLFGVDAILNSKGVWPVEVNPRYTASVEVLERACGWSAIALQAAACAGRDLPRLTKPTCNRVSGKAILFANAPLEIAAAWTTAAMANLDAGRPGLADIPPAGTIIEAGWPIVTVLADATDESAAFDALRSHAANLRKTVVGMEVEPLNRRAKG